MKVIIAILAMIMMAGLVGSCVIKEEDMETKNYEIKDFTKIEVGGAFEVEIEQSDTFQVSVTADEFSHIRVEKTGDTLVIKRQGIEAWAPFHRQPKARVSLPALTGVIISGASHSTVRNFHSDNDLTVNVSGASHVQANNMSAGKIDIKAIGASTISGDIKAQDAKLEATGASKIELTGTGANAEITVIGASRAELNEFPVKDAVVKVTGASHAFININGRLDANVTGASNLYWSGSPTMGDIQTTGASNLRRK